MKRSVPNKPTEMIAITGSARRAVPEAKLIKKSDQTARIEVSIYARQNPAAPAKNPLTPDAMNNTLPGQRHYLTDEEFNSTFGADPADLDKIAAWAPPNQ